MKTIVAAVAALGLCVATAARADLQNITSLYNTGVDNSGVALPSGLPDPHYTFAVPPPSGVAPITANSATGFPVAPGGPWLGDSPTSAWIVPTGNTTGNAGDYTYRTTFTLPAGINLSQVYIAGHWASDNDGKAIRLNGQAAPGVVNTRGFGAYAPFLVKGNFVSGVNTLDFVVNEASGSLNNGGFTGLRAEMAGRYVAPGRATIPTLHNSGTDPTGAPLPNNTVDPLVTLGVQSALLAPVLAKREVNGFPIPPYIADDAYSAWLVPTLDTNGPGGDYYYETAFDLTGFKPGTVEIYGRWATDNGGVDILLNGAPTGNSLDQASPTAFTDFTDFTLSGATGETFLPGLNTLTFVVHNEPNANPTNPTGVRWEFLSATGELVPEPGAVVSLMLLGGTSLIRRRRKR